MHLFILLFTALIQLALASALNIEALIPAFSFPTNQTLSNFFQNGSCKKEIEMGFLHKNGGPFLKTEPISKCVNSGMFALTFDHSLNPKYTPMLLDLLKMHKVTATFYIRSKCNLFDPQDDAAVALLKRIAAENHTIGISMTAKGAFKNVTEFIEDLGITTIVMYETIGVLPRFVRLPKQNITQEMATLIDALGYTRVEGNLNLDSFNFTNENFNHPKLQHFPPEPWNEFKCTGNRDGTLDSVIAIQDDHNWDLKHLNELIYTFQKYCRFYNFVGVDKCLNLCKENLELAPSTNLKQPIHQNHVSSHVSKFHKSKKASSLHKRAVTDLDQSSIKKAAGTFSTNDKKYVIRLPDTIPDHVVHNAYNGSKNYLQYTSLLKIKMNAETKTKLDSGLKIETLKLPLEAIFTILPYTPKSSSVDEPIPFTVQNSTPTVTEILGTSIIIDEKIPQSTYEQETSTSFVKTLGATTESLTEPITSMTESTQAAVTFSTPHCDYPKDKSDAISLAPSQTLETNVSTFTNKDSLPTSNSLPATESVTEVNAPSSSSEISTQYQSEINTGSIFSTTFSVTTSLDLPEVTSTCSSTFKLSPEANEKLNTDSVTSDYTSFSSFITNSEDGSTVLRSPSSTLDVTYSNSMPPSSTESTSNDFKFLSTSESVSMNTIWLELDTPGLSTDAHQTTLMSNEVLPTPLSNFVSDASFNSETQVNNLSTSVYSSETTDTHSNISPFEEPMTTVSATDSKFSTETLTTISNVEATLTATFTVIESLVPSTSTVSSSSFAKNVSEMGETALSSSTSLYPTVTSNSSLNQLSELTDSFIPTTTLAYTPDMSESVLITPTTTYINPYSNSMTFLSNGEVTKAVTSTVTGSNMTPILDFSTPTSMSNQTFPTFSFNSLEASATIKNAGEKSSLTHKTPSKTKDKKHKVSNTKARSKPTPFMRRGLLFFANDAQNLSQDKTEVEISESKRKENQLLQRPLPVVWW